MPDLKLVPNENQFAKWFSNVRLFLAPVGLIYLIATAGILSVEGHSPSLKDFVPTTFVQGGIALYLVNSAIDYLKKIKAS